PPLLAFPAGLALAGLALGLGACRPAATRGQTLLAGGLERLALGDTAAARQTLETATYIVPDDARILFHLGRLQAAEGSIEARVRAEKTLRRAVALAPRVGAYREALGEVLRRQGFHHESTSMLG